MTLLRIVPAIFYTALFCLIAFDASADPCSAPLASAGQNDADIVADVKDSVVFVEAIHTEPTGKITTETGTGFIVSGTGFVITANHVIAANGSADEQNTKVKVIIGSRTGVKLDAYVVPVSSYNDTALLQLPASHRPYSPVNFGDPDVLRQMDHLIAVGFPLEEDYSPASGAVGNEGSMGGLWQVSIPLNYGNSGGPIFNSSGQVVGMVKGGVAQAQLINYMVPLNLLSPLLIAANVTWPPYCHAANPAPVRTLVPSAPTNKRGNCHEVDDMAFGIPPTYTKRIVCE